MSTTEREAELPELPPADQYVMTEFMGRLPDENRPYWSEEKMRSYALSAADQREKKVREELEATASEDTRLLDWFEQQSGQDVFKLGNNWYARKGSGMPHRKYASLRAAARAAIERRS